MPLLRLSARQLPVTLLSACFRSAPAVPFGEWNVLKEINSIHYRQSHMEKICIKTAAHPEPEYPFETPEKCFYKFPSYLRRLAINEAVGKVSSYISNLERWEDTAPAQKGRKPSLPKAGHAFPVFYHKNMYQRTGDNTAKIKIYIRNTWDWLEVSLKKGDADYIKRHCIDRKECSPTLQKRGKEWFLNFAFKETVVLKYNSFFKKQETIICNNEAMVKRKSTSNHP